MLCCSLGFGSELSLVHAKIYTSPTAPAIEDGTIVIHAGRIVRLGPSAKIEIPRHSTVIDCKGLVATAGFWNSHVHILTPGLLHAEKTSAAQITSQLELMFTRWGFTTVFDIASVERNTILIRHRIETGEVKGPRILTVGEPFWIKTPIYVKAFLEANHIAMPEVESTEQAATRVQQQIQEGADGIKIFANSVEDRGSLTMSQNLADAIVRDAHRAGKPVFAHVANDQGIEVALNSGVDILAHTTPEDGLWSTALAERMKRQHVALTPTLTLWDFEGTRGNWPASQIQEAMTRASEQLRVFSKAGGQVLFGTDVGYTDHWDTSEEFTWMSRAGMSFQQILASLTTNPATRFGYSKRSGTVAIGMDADLVLLDGDPANDITAFSRVHSVIRSGQLIYSAH